MSSLPIIEGILKYTNEKNISFCMPGHKGGRGFFKTSIGKEFIDKILDCDITEVDGVDNLHNAEGMIKEAQNLLTKFYGSKKSYFLVNGSTSGNMAMIFSSFNEGDKVLVERNCHRSIFNAIVMRKLQPIYIKNNINEILNAPVALDMNHLVEAVNNNKDAKGIIITYPNYYGICCNLKKIINLAKENNMKVLVDSAHGAHFGIHEGLPESAIKLGADMVVTSTHKTLPSFTQTAYLHVNNGQDIERTDFYVSAFLSTSPSYLFLASMDYARHYLECYGKDDYSNLLNLTYKYSELINSIDGFKIIDKKDIKKDNEIYSIDSTRYVINLSKGYSGYLLLDYLRSNSIQAEMSDMSNVVLIFSPFNTEDEFYKLYEVLKDCNLQKLKAKDIKILEYNIPKSKYIPFEIMNKRSEKIHINSALNRVCKEAIVPYPPGIPILNIGEVIDKESIDVMKYYIKNEVEILGMDNNYVRVVIED